MQELKESRQRRTIHMHVSEVMIYAQSLLDAQFNVSDQYCILFMTKIIALCNNLFS